MRYSSVTMIEYY